MCLLGYLSNCLTVVFCILCSIKISSTSVSDGVSGTETNSCKFTLSNDEVIDLSPLVNSSQPMIVSTNTSLYIYHPCGDVPFKSKVFNDCQKSYGLCYFVANNATDKPIDFKKVLSNDIHGNFTLLALNAEGVFRENRLNYPEIVYKHNNNNTVISTYIQLVCNEKIGYYNLIIEKSSALEHVLILNSKHLCFHTAEYMSGGTVFFIILVVFITLYFIGGVLVLKFIRGATGIEMIPNHEFWCNLPQLAKEKKAIVKNSKAPFTDAKRICFSQYFDLIISTSTKKFASDEQNICINHNNLRESSPVFRSYEEELEHRLEHDPSPTESELIHDLENDFGDEVIEKYNRERICFLERSASFNTDRNGQQGAFAKYPNTRKPKRSSSFCGGTSSVGKSTNSFKPDSKAGVLVERKSPREEIRKCKKLLRCRSFEGQIDSSESEDYVEYKSKNRFSETKKREKRKVKKEKKFQEKFKSFTGQKHEYGSVKVQVLEETKFSFDKESVPVNDIENISNKDVPKHTVRSKPVPPPVPVRKISNKSEDIVITHKTLYSVPQTYPREREVEGHIERYKTTINIPPRENQEEKLESVVEESEGNTEGKEKSNENDERKDELFLKAKSQNSREAKSEALDSCNKKGALQILYEEGLKKIQGKHNSDSGTEEKFFQESELDNPFKKEKDIEIGVANYVVKRPQTLKIRVGFESPAIGQELDTPPDLADTTEKTLPYYLKSQEAKVLKTVRGPLVSYTSKASDTEVTHSGRFENNIEYEKYVELGKNLIKVTTALGKDAEKTLEEAEVDRRIFEGQIQKLEDNQNSFNGFPKKSLKKLDLSRKVKISKPDYSNEIREEVEPITPDTDQSEIEEILETFSKELKNSDVNEILSSDESRQKRSPAIRETAFLSSPPTKDNLMPLYDKDSIQKESSLPQPVVKTRDQVLKTAILRKEARPNSLPLRINNRLPNTSLTLENYVERRKMNYPTSGRVSAPLFKEYHNPGYISGRRSVPVDHERNIIPERGRSLTRNIRPRGDQETIYNENFLRNNLRTRSLTRDTHTNYPDVKSEIQKQVIYESGIPKPVNNKTVAGMTQIQRNNQSPAGYYNNGRDPGRFSATEIEAVFWERLKKKKIRESLREQELLVKKESDAIVFARNAPERSTIGPIYQKDDKVQLRREQNGGVDIHEKTEIAPDGSKKMPENSKSASDLEGKRKKDEKGFSISKIPFFRRRSKSGLKEDSYKRASEDYEDYQGNHISNSSHEETDTSSIYPKRVSFDQADNANWTNKNHTGMQLRSVRSLEKHPSSDSDVFLPNSPTKGSDNPTASRPLPPLPKEIDRGGYGVILRNKENPLQGQKSSEYNRIAVVETHRASPYQEMIGKVATTPRSMAIIHENELYKNSKVRESEGHFPPKFGSRSQTLSDTESGSEAGEIQRILHGMDKRPYSGDEEWSTDGKGRGVPGGDLQGSSGIRDDEIRRLRRPGTRRDDPRRHTLTGGHHQSSSVAKSMDLESPLPRGYPPPSSAMLYDDDPGIMSEAETSSTGFRRGGKQRSSLPVVRTPSKTLERPLGLVFLQYRSETKRALLPNEITSIDTVKALFVRSFPKQLTMEYLDSPMVKIYIHDSSKDMFYELEDLRSHLRDIRDRSVLRLFEVADINGGAGGAVPGGPGLLGPAAWDQDQSYFSEPEFDSEYQHQHIHKSKSSKSTPQSYYMTHSFPPGQSQGAASSATLPRGGSLLRNYSPAVGAVLPSDRVKSITPSGPPPSRRVPPSNSTPVGRFYSQERLHSESGYMSSPERGGARGYSSYVPPGGGNYEDPYYAQGYGTRTGSITPIIDEEASDTEMMDDSYHIYGVGVRGNAPAARAATQRRDFPAAAQPFDATRLRVEHMERQLANLTGLVQKALTQTPVVTPRDYLSVPAQREAYRTAADDYDKHSSSSSASLPDKSVSFEKSVSFSDDPPDMSSPKQHSPQHSADTKPAKPAIKSSTLPRTSSQERDRHKPSPPPKPISLSPGQYDNRIVDNRLVYRDLQLTPEMYNQLRGLQKKAKDLRQEMRNLRRMSQAQAHSIKETIRDTFIKIRAMFLAGGDFSWAAEGDKDRLRLSREEELYKQEMIRLEKDLTELESTVEELRGNVINRKTRVNMSDVEDMALVLSKSSKTVADLKVRFPGLQEGIKSLLSAEMDKVVREEKFLKEEPERLENALRRCKKLTGTLVTLKRLASVQEQRLPSSTGEPRLSPTPAELPPAAVPSLTNKPSTGGVSTGIVLASTGRDELPANQRPENALDALLDELQTFARPPGVSQSPSANRPPPISEIGRRKGSIDSNNSSLSGPLPPATSSLRRLHSYPSSSDDSSPPVLSRDFQKPATGPKPPVPERNAELLSQLANRRVPPPPPPRTSSRSPLASPTSPSLPPRATLPFQPQMGINTGTLRRNAPGRNSLRESSKNSDQQTSTDENSSNAQSSLEVHSAVAFASNSSSCESVNSQEGIKNKESRKEQLEQRHQELLRKQKALQEQYARLQQLQRGATALAIPTHDLILKKTGSESNLLSKMGLGQNLSAAASISGSLTHLAPQNQAPLAPLTIPTTHTTTSTTKIYETDIL